MVYNFGDEQHGAAKEAFYEALDAECAAMNHDGGLGLLINNVGVNEVSPFICLCLAGVGVGRVWVWV